LCPQFESGRSHHEKARDLTLGYFHGRESPDENWISE